jgi:hypothetical protein
LVQLLILVWTAPLVAQPSADPPCKKAKDIRVYRTLLDPENVKDIFGARIAQRYVALQVTISNQCVNHQQFLIHDLSLDLTNVLSEEQRRRLKAAQGEGATYELSSEELSILRGVAEKGQHQDPRNRFLRYLRGAGTIAAGLIGVTTFGASYAPSVAVFNGPVLTAYSETFPDFTINQLVRLHDSAYVANTLVPEQQAKVVVVFLPQRIFMTNAQRKRFWKEPVSVFNEVDFRLAEIVVDGNFIVEQSEPGTPRVRGIATPPLP